MRVLLVDSNQTRDLLPAPPIGLSYVASAAQRTGHAVHFIDLLISAHPLDDLRNARSATRRTVAAEPCALRAEVRVLLSSPSAPSGRHTSAGVGWVRISV